MQVVQPNVVMAQQQPSYIDRLLARLMSLGQLGTQGWQAWQYGQQVENQKDQHKRMVLEDVLKGNFSSPEAYDILVELGKYSPEAARKISSAAKFKGAGQQLDALQQRESGLGSNNSPADGNYLQPDTFAPDFGPGGYGAPYGWGRA